jgi:tetratricopeptide (TPR) repeat protein
MTEQTRNRVQPDRPPTVTRAEQAVRERPEDPEAHLTLGIAFEMTGDCGRGLESFETAARLDPLSAAIRYNIGVCHRQAGRLLKAAESFDHALRLDERLYAAWIGRAGIRARLGDFPDAREAARTVARLRPDEKDPWRMLLFVELLDGNWPAIDAAVEAYVSRGGDTASLFFESRELFGERRTVEIAGAVRSRRGTLAAEAAFFLGDYFTGRRQADAAIASLLDARSLGREDATTLVLLTRAYSVGGRAIEAEAAVRLATALDPADPGAWLERGKLLNTLGKSAEAIEAYRTAIRIAPENGIIWYNLAYALAQAGEIEESIAAYREAARLGPESSRALNNLGWVYWSTDRESEARTAFTEAIRENPSNGRAWGNLGQLLAGQGDREGGIRCLREAIRLRPDRTDLAIELLELDSQTPSGGG